MTQIGLRKGTKVSGTVYNKTLTSAVTSLTISGLDGNADGGYEFEFAILNPAGGATTYSLYYNNDQTVANYQRAGVVSGATAIAAFNYNDGVIVSIAASGYATLRGNIVIHPSGRIVTLISQSRNDHEKQDFEHTHPVAVANLTRIDIVASVASKIDVNSRFRLWRKP